MSPLRPYQPYRRNVQRPQTGALRAMLAGKPLFLPNPMDIRRQAQKHSLLRALRR